MLFHLTCHGDLKSAELFATQLIVQIYINLPQLDTRPNI